MKFSDKLQYVLAVLLVRLGRLKYEDFSEEELNDLLPSAFPISVDVPVPIGTGTLVCDSGSVHLHEKVSCVELRLDTRFEVVVVGNPVYRAHIQVYIHAEPEYITHQHRLKARSVSLSSMDLINDEYSLIKDTSFLLEQFPPVNVANTLVSPLKGLLNTFTGGISNAALAYLGTFTKDNKQKLLDDHKPAIEQSLIDFLGARDLSYEMNPAIWREALFIKYGRNVTVEDQRLRFWLS